MITVEAESGKFIIKCPLWANDALMNITSKRWSKAKRAWTLPVLRQNVAQVKKLAEEVPNVQLHESARIAIAEHDSSVRISGPGFPVWYKFKTKPLAHQKSGLEKLYPIKRGFLVMGLQTGKTKTTIDLLAAHRMEGHIDGVLILVKRTLRRNWLDQLDMHCPIPYSALLPETGDKGLATMERWLKSKPDFPIMLVGWESLSAGGMYDICQRFIHALQKPALAGDETTYITNHKSERTKRSCARKFDLNR